MQSSFPRHLLLKIYCEFTNKHLQILSQHQSGLWAALKYKDIVNDFGINKETQTNIVWKANYVKPQKHWNRHNAYKWLRTTSILIT